jgi:hypothetical protein
VKEEEMRRESVAAFVVALLICVLASEAVAAATNPLKWSQPAFQIGTTPDGVPIFWGWDQRSWSVGLPPSQPQAADDWLCIDQRPVTDIHWWGSYPGKLDQVPQISPSGFWFGIYTDVPASPTNPFSYPGQLIWQYATTNYTEKFVGYDVIMPGTPLHDATFQYDVYLPTTNWFYQPGGNNILWLSIVAIYQPQGAVTEWGWKTRPHYFQDAATMGNPSLGWQPLIGYDGLPWDLSFQLTTVPEPGGLFALAVGLVGLAGYGIRRTR